MSLQFVTGSSGAGKSYILYREMIRESLEHPEKQFLVIVPEQFTMQTQKEMVEMHPRKGLLNIDVLSFNRLAYRVFAEVGGDTLPVLEDTGKSLVVQKVIEDHRKDLKVTGRALAGQGAVAEMKSLVSELLQYRIRPEDLEAWIGEQNSRHQGRLADKLEDIRLIYESFGQYLQDHYLTTEEVPERLCEVIGESGLVRGSVILLDSFTGFTPVQEKVVLRLLQLAESVTVTLTIDRRADLAAAKNPHHLFHMTGQMFERTRELAREAKVPMLPIREIVPGEKSRFGGRKALAFLENRLFRMGRSQTFEGEQEEIRILEAEDPEQEMLAAAQQIARMIRQPGEKYHYRDFAVVTGDLPTYGRTAAGIFEAAGIPYFLDQKKSVNANPGIEFVRSAIDMIVQQYSYESVIRFLRTGMAGFTREEVDDFENYILALGIRGRKKYENPWRRTTETGKGKVKKAVDPEKLLYYNEIRQRFADLTAAFDAGMHERMGTARRKTEVLYDFLLKTDLQGQLEARERFFHKKGDLSREREYAQIYRTIIDLLDKVVEVLGEEKIRLKTYQEILDAGFQEETIGLVPPGEDQVLIGDIERTRLLKVRVLFFVGVNEGVVPKADSSGGILSETDRENLERSGAELAPTARERIYRQRFYLYLAMTKPSDRLYLSYCRNDADGAARSPSYLIGTILRMFRGLSVRVQNPQGDGDIRASLETPVGERKILLEELQNMPSRGLTPAGETLLWAMNREAAGKLLKAVSAGRAEDGIPAALARKLYGTDLNMSITRLEDFSSCPFRHFLDYGICLQPREEYIFTPADFGTIMHEALRRFSVNLQKRHLGWDALTDAERDALADQSIREVTDSYGNTILQSSSRNAYLAERLRAMMRRTVWALQEQVKRGRFRPAAFEFQFGNGDDLSAVHFRLENGTRMGLMGRIDRMDICEADGIRYVKVVDYKTGSTELDMNQIYAGLQLQLTVYMNAAVEKESRLHPGEDTEPAGLFYYRIRDPLIDEVPESEREEAMLKELRPDGIVRAEYPVQRLFDEETESGASDVLPSGVKLTDPSKAAKKRKDSGTSGKRAANAKARSEEDFSVLADFTNEKVQELGKRMISGETAVSPYVQFKGSKVFQACAFCGYGGVCGFDERLPGFAYRRIGSGTADDVLEEMRRKLKK